MKADLNIIDYTINECVFKISSALKNAEPIKKPWEFKLDWGFDIKQNKKNVDNYKLVFWVSVIEANKKSFPYTIHMEMMALLKYKPNNKSLPEKEIGTYVILSGISILYGIMRSTVSLLSSQSYHGKFILPPINFVADLKNKMK